MRKLAFIFLVCLWSAICFADSIEFLVISSAGGKGVATGPDGIPYKVPQVGGWPYAGFSTLTTNVISQCLLQVGESGNISDVTGVAFVRRDYIEDMVSTNAFWINKTTFADTTQSFNLPDRVNGYATFDFIVRKSGINTTYETATFPNILKKNIYKVHQRFEAGNP